MVCVCVVNSGKSTGWEKMGKETVQGVKLVYRQKTEQGKKGTGE